MLKKQKGITLIALIITIIVMLILVGVTINVALNGGLFDKAKDAAKEMEEKAMYEQIVMGMQLDGNKIDIEETFSNADETLKITNREDGTNYIVITVQGKNGTYTYTITDEKIIIGEIEEDNKKIVERIEIKASPTLVNYNIGDTLNTEGLVITAAYNDGTIKDITSGLTCTPTKLETVGEQEITVTYGGKTATFKVIVTNEPKTIKVGDVWTNIDLSALSDPKTGISNIENLGQLEIEVKNNETSEYWLIHRRYD